MNYSMKAPLELRGNIIEVNPTALHLGEPVRELIADHQGKGLTAVDGGITCQPGSSQVVSEQDNALDIGGGKGLTNAKVNGCQLCIQSSEVAHWVALQQRRG